MNFVSKQRILRCRQPPKPKTKIEPVREKSQHEIIIPNVIRIDHVYKTHLELDWDNVQTLTIEPNEAITEAQMAAIISGKPNEKLQSLIGLDKIAKDTRLQTIVFKVAAAIYNIEKANIHWSGAKEIFLAQVTKLTNSFLESNKILFGSSSVNSDENVKKIHLILNMSKIIQHVWAQIKVNNVDELTAVFDNEKPILSTADIRTWFTSKPCEWLNKSHINFCVYDSDWETSEARFLDKSNLVKSFVKNDHLGFYVAYNYKGVIRKYFPDFIIQLSNGDNLILEVKGEDSDQNKTKREYLNEWVMAINNHGGFGMWHWLVSFNPNDIEDKIKELLNSSCGNIEIVITSILNL
jgi:type III restriction enzyme